MKTSVLCETSSLFRCDAYNQLLDSIVDTWSPWIRAILGTIELPRDKLAVPSEDRLRSYDTRHLFERSLAEPFPDLGQGSALTVSQAQTTPEPIPQNAILGHEVLIAQQQFLINRSGDVRQHCRPVHRVSSRELEYILDTDL